MPALIPAQRLLTLDANLVLTVNDEDVQISGEQDVLTVNLPSLRAGRALLHSGPFTTDRVDRFKYFDWLLRDVGLTADVKLVGEPIARLGKEARPGRIARLLRLGQAEVYPAAIVTTSVRQRKGLAVAIAGVAGALGVLLFLKRR